MDTSETEINEEVGKELRETWDKFAESYSNNVEYSTLQGSTVLYTQTRSKYGKKIIEAGIGPGIGTRLFALVYMQPGAVYYCSDISPEMINIVAKNFNTSDLGKWDNISMTVLEESKMHNVEDFDSTNLTKRLFATPANNEKMPFPDASFDRYISGISMMAVDNHMNQIKEAYRILENGGIAGFSVWGRKENSLTFSVMPEAMKNLGIVTTTVPPNFFKLNDDAKLKSDLESVGFTCVKTFYSPCHFSLDVNEAYSI